MGMQEYPDALEVDKGLRSLGGIRWLLLAGALLTAVSVYRLVQTQWATLPPPVQFLVLTAGALSVFGAGLLTRRRLALPQAGSALLSLFAVLIPVLSWGATRLGLFGDVPGVLAFALGMGALLAAARRALREVVRYDRWLFLAALLVLAIAPPVLTALAPSRGASLFAALALGGVFLAGSRHVNRFLFHRDRRDGADRPVSAVPFVVLGALYAVAVAALPHPGAFVALPLAVAGAVLVDTGEEYFAALCKAEGRPDRWPRRSVALLSVGFSLLAGAVALAPLSGDERCLPLVSLLAAWRLLAWSLRYESRVAHAAGLVSALLFYNSSPLLFQTLSAAVRDWFLALSGVRAGSPALASFGDLGFVAFLVVLALSLARRDAPEPLRRVHALIASAHGLLTVAFALADPHAARLYLPVALASFALALLITRRLEWLAACQAAAAGAVLALTAGLLGTGLLDDPGVRGLAAALVALTLAAPALEAALARRVENPGAVHAAFLHPLVLAASFVVLVAGSDVLNGRGLAGLSLSLGGAALLVAAHRLPSFALAGLSVFPLSLGLHGLASELGSASAPAVLTLALFAASYLVARRSAPGSVTAAAGWTGVVLHAGLGLLWLLEGSVNALFGPGLRSLEAFGPRPLILLAIALAFLDAGFRRQRVSLLAPGLLALLAYTSVQLWAAGVLDSLAAMGAVSALELLGIALLAGRSAEQRWCLLARAAEKASLVVLPLGCCLGLIVSGWSAALLCLSLVALAMVAGPGAHLEAPRRLRVPLAVLLLALAQVAVAIHGEASGVLVLDVLAGGLALLPLFILAAFAWQLASDAAGAEDLPELATLSVLLEAMVLWAFFLTITSAPGYPSWAEAALVLSALAYAARHAGLAWFRRRQGHAWALQGALAVAVVEAFACGYLRFGSGRSPFVLLAAGCAVWGTARLLARTDRREVFELPCLASAHLLTFAAASLSVARTAGAVPEQIWWRVLPAFLASALYVVMASRSERRAVPAMLSAAFLAAGFTAVVHAAPGLEAELTFLGPGVALLGLSRFLDREMGPDWSRRVFTAGATLVYATPLLMLRHDMPWGWQVALLAVSLGFGAASFGLRSRSLLIVSTAAFVVDLGCFVLKVHQTEPLVVWVLGAAAGLSTMALAGWLEWRREGVLQQIRIFLGRLEAWQ